MKMMGKAKMIAVAALCAAAVAVSGLAGEAAGPITAERAREIALAQTGGGEVMELDRHYGRDGVHYYRLEILSKDGAYHVEIDESNGRLLQFIRKHGNRGYAAPVPGAPLAGPVNATGSGVTYEQALAIALGQTGGGVVVESEIDKRKGGRLIYEFEIVNNGVKSEVEIDMGTGAVIQFKQKGRRYHLPVTPVIPPATSSAVPSAAVAPTPVEPASQYSRTRLDIAAAQALAREKIGGGTVVEYKLDHDDGRLIHEIKVVHGGTRYEVDIDDASGTVIKLSVD